MKRAPGTGSVTSYESIKGGTKWRCRTPGKDGRERGGFASYAEAESVLEAALRGVELPRARRRRRSIADLHVALARAHLLAAYLGVRVTTKILGSKRRP